ncbi:MAG: nicotinate (nicotinamide) nucleotide adenylyltransferase [candidate division Zixibacteria bacterium]|nr:nicotinate (nicotinamide) nucleotide adenylyltransferase [candidate division Zixibacteria bacterium]
MPAPEPGQKWGILGGVFDPVHLGHLAIATEIFEDRQLDGVFLTPAFDPPHRDKQPHATFSDRVVMLQMVCESEPRLSVCTIEKDLKRPSYTLRTIRALRQKYKDVDFRFIIGADNLVQLKTWHHWETLLDEVHLLVGYRPGANLDAIDDYPQMKIDIIETKLVDISSTDIREAVRQGVTDNELKRLVSPQVADYIIKNGLYR